MKKLLILVLVFIQTSCALVFNKAEVPVSFRSVPDKANIYVNGISVGQTPFDTTLVPNGYYDVIYQKEGYANQQFKVIPYPRNNASCLFDRMGYLLILPLFGALSDKCQTFDSSYTKSLDKGGRTNILLQ